MSDKTIEQDGKQEQTKHLDNDKVIEGVVEGVVEGVERTAENNNDDNNDDNIEYSKKTSDESTDAPTNTLDDLPDDLSGDLPDDLPEMNEQMLEQVQEMMDKLQRVDDLEAENTTLKSKLGRLTSDFEGYRNRTTLEIQESENKGISKAAETLMPIYDDLARAISMGTEEPEKLIPGVAAVQNKLISLFAHLGLEATGHEGETFDPQWHEAIQVIDGEEDNIIVQVFELGFRMGDHCVRPARVIVSQKA